MYIANQSLKVSPIYHAFCPHTCLNEALCCCAYQSMIQGNDYSHAHLLSAGIKIFTRQDSRTNPADTYCKWRIPSDGLSTMLPYLDPNAMLHADVDDLRMLLEEQYPLVSSQEDDDLR